MSTSSYRKSIFLGMPFGTASNQLRKRIMLNLLQKLGEDFCYRCGQKIETVDELSIEHKKAWQGVDISLFWDLDNIAFSHLDCNIRHRPVLEDGVKHNRGKKTFFRSPKRNPPPGKSWCIGHEDFLPIEMFGKNRHEWNGLRNRCKKCFAMAEREYRAGKKSQN